MLAKAASRRERIIEIGLCLLDVTSGHREFKQSILVRQTVDRDAFCTRLTTLTAEDVAQGSALPMPVTCGRNAAGPNVWGATATMTAASSSASVKSAASPTFGFTHINIKNLAGLMLRLDHDVSLPQALSYFGWELEGTYHRGSDDAWNAARLLSVLLWGRR